MLHGKLINLRLIRHENECRTLSEAFNDLSQRGIGDHTELKHLQSRLKKFAENGLWGEEQGILLITDKQDVVVGSIGFKKMLDFELELGYRIVRQEHRGQGYMTEALSLFSAYLFATKPVHRLRLQIAADNIPSRKLAEKCGYQQEGALRKAYFYRGRFCDFVIYGMLREECANLSDLITDQ